jgi:hypothetical protein
MNERPGLPGEIPGAGVDADGAVAPRVGRDRGTRPRPGRHRSGGAGHGDFDLDDRPRAPRTAVASPPAAGTRTAAGRGAQADDRQGSHAPARSGGPGRADDLGGPGLPPALDREEHPDPSAHPAEHGPPGQPSTGAGAPQRRGVQLRSSRRHQHVIDTSVEPKNTPQRPAAQASASGRTPASPLRYRMNGIA